jgi:hypothetical protein
MKFMPQLTGSQTVQCVQDEKLKAFRKLSQKQQAVLTEASIDGALQTVDMEEAQDDDDDQGGHSGIEASRARYYAYQTAIGGTSACVGPPIETSARALQMRRIDDNGEEAYEYINFSYNEVKRKPKPYQVNGAAWALASLYSEIPFEEDASEDVKTAAADLRRPKVPGILILDQTGTGKSIQAMQIVLGRGRPCAIRGLDQRPIYKPIFLAAPQNLIRQWAREILFEWPIFDLLISYDDGAIEPYLAEHVVSSSTVRAWPSKKLWPKKYAYMIDPSDARNARLIFLTTPETNAERSLVKTEIVHPAVSLKPPRFKRNGDEIFECKQWTEIKYSSSLGNVFSVGLVDEATKIKSTNSIRHIAGQKLLAQRWIFMTATAMLNTGTVSHFKSTFLLQEGMQANNLNSASWGLWPSYGKRPSSSFFKPSERTLKTFSIDTWAH